MKFGLRDEDIRLIIATASEVSAIKQIIIFGSRAMGNYKQGSDVDLALKGNITDDLLANFKYKLNEELPVPYFFDVVDYQSITQDNLKKHIDTHGKVFYERRG